MVENTLVDGKMVNNMAKEHSTLQLDKGKRENGRMDKGRDGSYLKREMIRINKK